MTSPRRLATTFLVTFLGSCALIAALNFVVNPMGNYSSKLFRPLTWSSRSIKADLMLRRDDTKVLVVGSSRLMKLSPALLTELTGLTAFNAAVDSGRTEDWHAFLRFALEECGWSPSMLIVGVDVEAFHDHVETEPQLIQHEQLSRYLPAEVRRRGFIKQARALLSLSQVLESVRSLQFNALGFPRERSKFEADGLLRYLQWEQQLREGTFKPSIKHAASVYRKRLASMKGLDTWRTSVFEAMLELCQQRGIKVVAFITPLDPKLASSLASRTDYVRLHGLVVDYLRGLERRFPNFTARNYAEPAAFGGSPDLFFDGAHMMDENADRLVRSLLAHAVQ